MTTSTVNNFLDNIINDYKGNINIEYVKYINIIESLINNGFNETNEYNNYINNINNSHLNFPSLNEIKNLIKSEQPSNINRNFCVYLWMYLHR